MRPNLTLGPIDSVGQYLLYLSVVVFGILLPLAIQKWVRRRQDRQLLAATRSALSQEIEANRSKVRKSHASFAALATALGAEIAAYRALWQAHGGRTAASPPPDRPPGTESPVLFAATLRTAWEIAALRQALPLLPPGLLAACSRAYQLQGSLEQDRSSFLALAMRVNALEAPADLGVARHIERRLEALLELQAMSEYHAGLAMSLLDAYDEVLRVDA